jgi:hypothetical protein
MPGARITGRIASAGLAGTLLVSCWSAAACATPPSSPAAATATADTVVGASPVDTTTVTTVGTFVEVSPNTAAPGTRVTIRASCDNGNTSQATVESEAFGRVVVRPNNGFLTGAVTIPGNKAPGTFGVNLTCPNGNTATTTITVVNMSKPTQGPATGVGGTAGGTSPMLMAGGIAALVLVVVFGLIGAARRRHPGTGL